MEGQARLTIETHGMPEDDSCLLNWNAMWFRIIRGSSRLNLRERETESEEIARLIDASIGAIIKEMVPHQIPRRQIVLGQRAMDILPRSTLLTSTVARNVRERGDAEAELTQSDGGKSGQTMLDEGIKIPEKNPIRGSAVKFHSYSRLVMF